MDFRTIFITKLVDLCHCLAYRCLVLRNLQLDLFLPFLYKLHVSLVRFLFNCFIVLVHIANEFAVFLVHFVHLAFKLFDLGFEDFPGIVRLWAVVTILVRALFVLTLSGRGFVYW
jgi:hypothetical protein